MTTKLISQGEVIKRNISKSLINMTPICIILVSACVALLWFKKNTLLWGVDGNFPLNINYFVNQFRYIWDPNTQTPDTTKFAILSPFVCLLKLYHLTSLPFDPLIFERILIYGLFVISGLSVYLLVHILLENHEDYFVMTAALCGALFYMFNFYSMTFIWFPTSWIMFHYAFLPCIFGLFIHGIKKNGGARYAIFLAVLWTLTISPAYLTATIVFTDWCLLFLFFVYFIVSDFSLTNLRNRLTFSMWLGIVWCFLNAFWLLPFLSNFGDVVTLASGIGDVNGLVNLNSAQFADSFRISGYWALTGNYKGTPYYAWYTGYDSPLMIFISTFPAIFCGLSLLFKSSRKHAVFFAFILAITLFFVKGLNPPLSNFSSWIFDGVMGAAFRSVFQRFMGYAVLSYAVMFGLFVYGGCLYFKSKSKHLFQLFTGGSVLCTILMTGLYVWPMWTGDLFRTVGINPSMQIRIPNYYYGASCWLQKDPDEFRVLPLPFPTATVMQSLWWNDGVDGYVGPEPIAKLSSKTILMSGPDFGKILAEMIVRGDLRSSFLLNFHNIKYILLHRDANWEALEGHPWWTAGNTDRLRLSLADIEGLRMEKSFGNLDVYRNVYWKPYVEK